MLSISCPEIVPQIENIDYGIIPAYIRSKKKHILIVKSPKEAILAAKIHMKIGFYLIPRDNFCIGAVTAFYDNVDDPLIISTLFSSNDSLYDELKLIFKQKKFDIYFFNEQNLELFNARATFLDYERFLEQSRRRAELDFNDQEKVNSTLHEILKTFSNRAQYKKMKFDIQLYRNGFIEDMLYLDLRKSFNGMNKSFNNEHYIKLERDFDHMNTDGYIQEKEIALLLNRHFQDQNIYINPIRIDNHKKEDREFADILIDTDTSLIIIQAKDSPNNKSCLERSALRKNQTSYKHVLKASAQLEGALSYAKNNDFIQLKSDKTHFCIDTRSKEIIGLIVVKELFDDCYAKYSDPILRIIKNINMGIALFDYSQLHVITNNCKSSEDLIKCLKLNISVAIQNNLFPKNHYSKNFDKFEKYKFT
jgi:hypothetical protein